MIHTNHSLNQFMSGVLRTSCLITTSGESRPRHEHSYTNQCEDVCLNCTKKECNGNCPIIRKAKKERKNQK